jgi:hypothetical protein
VLADEQTGAPRVARVAPLSLAYDGRAIGDDVAARFVEALKRRFALFDTVLAASKTAV